MATWELYEILTVFSTLVMLAAVATYAVEKPLQQWLTTVLTVEGEPLQPLPGQVGCCGSCHIEPVDSSWRSGSTKFDDEESSDFVHTGSCGQAICCGCDTRDPSRGKNCCGGGDYCCAVDAFEVERDTCCCNDCCGGCCKRSNFIIEKLFALMLPCFIPVHENCCWNPCQFGYFFSKACCGNFCVVST